MQRCSWVPVGDPLYTAYHDLEWGVPVRDDRLLFEFLCLEGAQAGLSWRTILYKREAYRSAFAGFDPGVVAGFGAADVDRLMHDPGIVRNRAKITAAITNAQRVLDLVAREGSLADYLWSFAGGAPLVGAYASVDQIPSESAASLAMSRALRREGLRFVGPTICYGFMQATGMAMDHTTDCFRYRELCGAGA